MLSVAKYDLGMMYSDFLVTFACIYAVVLLNNQIKTQPVESGGFQNYWLAFFVFEGISFLLGGFAHGLITVLSPLLDILSWTCSIFGLLSFAIGVVRIVLPDKNRLLEISLYIVASATTYFLVIKRHFPVVIIYCFLIMFFVVYINSKHPVIAFKLPCSRGILIGTLLFVLSSFFFVFKIAIFSLAPGIFAHLMIAAGIIYFGYGCKATIAHETIEACETPYTKAKQNPQLVD